MKFPRLFAKLLVPSFLCFVFLIAGNSSYSQMRKIYSDLVPNNHNGINKLSFYSPSEGYVAFNKWIGYTADSGRSFSSRSITFSNVDWTGYSVNLTFGFGITGVKAFDKNNILFWCMVIMGLFLQFSDQLMAVQLLS
jgi:hypothetical protein